MTRTGNSIQILNLYYMTADEAAKIGSTPFDASLLAGTWKQMYVNSNASSFEEGQEALAQAQFGSKTKNDYTQPGFQRPVGKPERPLNIGFSATHADLLKAGLGKLVAAGSSKTLTEITNTLAIKVTSSSFVAGDWIKIISDTKTQYSKVSSVTPGTPDVITLDTPIETDTVVTTHTAQTAGYWTIDDGVDTDSYFHFLMETPIGNFIMTWVKPSVTFATELNALFKFMVNLMGDKIYKTTTVTAALIEAGAGSVASEYQARAVESNFDTILIDDASSCDVHSFILTLEKPQTLKPCHANLNGFGGVFQENFTLNLAIKTRNWETFQTLFENNTSFGIVASRADGRIIIDLPGCLVSSMKKFAEADGQYISDVNINANAIMTASPKFIFC